MTTPHRIGDHVPLRYRYGDVLIDRLYYGDILLWERLEDDVTIYDTVGAYSYDLAAARAAGYTHIDRICLGGGEGGTNGAIIANGRGGRAGQFAADTIVIADYPGVNTITGSVGAGGSSNGGDGGNSTSLISGGPTVTGAGGAGGVTPNAIPGESVTPLTYNGINYTGGAGGASAGANGGVPGGGGAGAGAVGAGGIGGRGQVWIRAYMQ